MMYKEPCPACGVVLPRFGPPMKVVPTSNRWREDVYFQCPACAAQLERVSSRVDQALVLLGSASIVGAIMLNMPALLVWDGSVMLPITLYAVAIIAPCAELWRECTLPRFRKRPMPPTTPSPSFSSPP